jgi:hypothetical protein
MRALVLNVTREFRPFFADRGGPIVLAQVENELHTNDQAYIDFCGELTVEAGIAIPWEMCNGASAVQTINTCNGGDCTSFIESNGQNGKVLRSQPALWTENWMGWFASWGDKNPAGDWPSFDSSPQSRGKSAAILRWFARGGSHINQYNWAGGNHFARTAGSSMVGVYYWDAPIASDNLAQGPERLHIARTFAALASSAVAPVLLAAPAQLHQQVNVSWYDSEGVLHPGDASHIAFVYKAAPGAGPDVLFFENKASPAIFSFGGFNFSVSSGSVLALSNGTTIFDSNDVIPLGRVRTWTPAAGALGAWQAWADPLVPATPAAIPAPTVPRTPWVGSALGAVVTVPAPLEAVSFSEYDTELVLYVANVSAAEVAAAVATSPSASAVNLTLASGKAQAWTAFVNGALAGTAADLEHAEGSTRLWISLDLSAAATSGAPLVLALLSTSLGIGNGAGVSNGTSNGVKGVTSTAPRSVTLGAVDLTARKWTHVAGAVGEAGAAFTPAGGAALPWAPLAGAATAPLTWLRTTFTAPSGVLAPEAGVEVTATLNLDVSGLSRGRFWVNGFDLGRFWSKLCGAEYMCQRYYPIPFDLLLAGAGANTLVVLDELGATNVSSAALAVSANTAPPPPPPCAVPAAGGAAGMYPCGSTGTALVASARAGGATAYALAAAPSQCLSAGTFVTFADCDAGNSEQSWGAGMTMGSGKCLDVFGQNASIGAPLDVWACNGGSNQRWDFESGELKSAILSETTCAGLCAY